MDSEFKIYHDLAHQLIDQYGSENVGNIKGSFYLYSERSLCGSCSDALQQFSNMFPGIRVQSPFYDYRYQE